MPIIYDGDQYYWAPDEDLPMDEILHYGTKHHSGRWPYGSGEFPYQHEPWFAGFGRGNGGKSLKEYVADLKAQGLSASEIAKGFGFTQVDQKTGELVGNKSDMDKFIRMEDAQNKLAALRQMQDLSNNYNKTPQEIADRLNASGQFDKQFNAATVTSWLKGQGTAKAEEFGAIKETILKNFNEKGTLLDVGKGTAVNMGVKQSAFDKALRSLIQDGYEVYELSRKRANGAPGQQQTYKVLAPPGMDYKEANRVFNEEQTKTIQEYSIDGGTTFLGGEPAVRVAASRIAVDYDSPQDGMFEIRRGVKDLDLGSAPYAQVRIGVENDYYMKGMAVYSDNLPPGVDILVHSNKMPGTEWFTPKDGVFKPMKKDAEGNIDESNPFGASLKSEGELRHVPRYYQDEDGTMHPSAINVVSEPGDWASWSKTLSTQFLAKQDLQLITRQLNKTREEVLAEYEELKSITNPTLKSYLLKSFADDCESSAVHLKLSGIEGQQSHVLLCSNDIKDDEVYAPNYENGSKVALVRYPHAGPYEIVVATVNNTAPAGINMIGKNAPDAIVLSKASHQVLSGADDDGDTVTVIPMQAGVPIKTASPFPGLVGYEPKNIYKIPDPEPGVKAQPQFKTNHQVMGRVANLITDMTTIIDADVDRRKAEAAAKGLPTSDVGYTPEQQYDLERATKLSMVAVDCVKHTLDFKQAEKDLGYKELVTKYRRNVTADYDEDTKESLGAGSLFSRAKNPDYVILPGKEKGQPKINKETGEKYQTYDLKQPVKPARSWVDKETGKLIEVPEKPYVKKTTKMATHPDAYELMSGNARDAQGRKIGTPKERAYANYANSQKSLAKEARLEALKADREAPKKLKADSELQKEYAAEVKSLNAKLEAIDADKPSRRVAQSLAQALFSQRRSVLDSYSDSDKRDEAEKKMRRQCERQAYEALGIKRTEVVITPREYEAIQAGAFAKTNFLKMLPKCDMGALRKIAVPKTESIGLTDSQSSRIYQLRAEGLTNAEIAARIDGVSATQVAKLFS